MRIFFFQAEDGIRDRNVTGVQTCALPILMPVQTISWLRSLWGPMRAEIEDEICEGDKVAARIVMHGHHVGEFLGKPATRSEERRVGKEGRSRRAADQYKDRAR